jgi:hypothetical protein
MLKTLIIIFSLINLNCLAAEQDSLSQKYIYYPGAFQKWDYRFMVGLSASKLPTAVVEEEISVSPMLMMNFRLGMPADMSFNFQLNSNYISTHGILGYQWALLKGRTPISIGAKAAAWMGHLELEAIRLKSWGMIISPYVSFGIDFDKFLLSAEFETQHSFMYTYSEEVLLGTIRNPQSGYGLRFTLEQPLWNDNWVLLSLKLNYAKFYYQSWLSFTTIDEYFLYPELIFGFVL